jgi:hypothetical protein
MPETLALLITLAGADHPDSHNLLVLLPLPLTQPPLTATATP